jgi:hypothetical protein
LTHLGIYGAHTFTVAVAGLVSLTNQFAVKQNSASVTALVSAFSSLFGTTIQWEETY